MSEMVERVAKAIAGKIVIIGRPIHHSWTEDAARAALEAMMCPPKEMLDPFYEPEISAFDAWNKAIETALSD